MIRDGAYAENSGHPAALDRSAQVDPERLFAFLTRSFLGSGEDRLRHSERLGGPAAHNRVYPPNVAHRLLGSSAPPGAIRHAK
jgi:hypothetical protein